MPTDYQTRLLANSDNGIYKDFRTQVEANIPGLFGHNSALSQNGNIRSLTQDPNQFIILTIDANHIIIGHARVARRRGAWIKHKAYISEVYVAPDRRGSGLGRAIVNAALDYANTIVEAVIINVSVKNTVAFELYRSMGFAAFGLEMRSLKMADGYDDEIMMELCLADRACLGIVRDGINPDI